MAKRLVLPVQVELREVRVEVEFGLEESRQQLNPEVVLLILVQVL